MLNWGGALHCSRQKAVRCQVSNCGCSRNRSARALDEWVVLLAADCYVVATPERDQVGLSLTDMASAHALSMTVKVRRLLRPTPHPVLSAIGAACSIAGLSAVDLHWKRVSPLRAEERLTDTAHATRKPVTNDCLLGNFREVHLDGYFVLHQSIMSRDQEQLSHARS